MTNSSRLALRAVALIACCFPAAAVAVTAAPTMATASTERLVLATYFPWYDDNTWNGRITADLPLEAYDSDDPATIARHVDEARRAGIDGFVSAYYLPGDRTDTNFARLLDYSGSSGFRSTVALQIGLDGQDADTIANTIAHLVARYGEHPALLRHGGRPVIFFTNLNRLPGPAGWLDNARLIRERADPHGAQVWIAEGLDFRALQVFDGIHVLKVMHAGLPNDYLKAPRWAANARAFPGKLWVATVMPGWDDTRTLPGGLRNPAEPFSQNREDGALLQRSWEAALNSDPDWVLVHSWNEWVEGSQIEPSLSFGDAYVRLLHALRAGWR